jgi:hypothetical protein
MKLLLAEDSIQLSKREEFMTILDPLLIWFTTTPPQPESSHLREEDFMYDCIFTPGT